MDVAAGSALLDAGARQASGAHSETLDREAFLQFFDAVGDLELDRVLEVKDKEQSALRAQQLTQARSLAPSTVR